MNLTVYKQNNKHTLIQNNQQLNFKNTLNFINDNNQDYFDTHVCLNNFINMTNQFNKFKIIQGTNEIDQYDSYTPFIEPCCTFLTNHCYKYSILTDNINLIFLKKNKNLNLNNFEINNVINLVQDQLNHYKLKNSTLVSIFVVRPILISNHVYIKNKIIGFKILSQPNSYYGILANDGKFYDEKGTGFVSTFLKSPLMKKCRISSQFNPHRIHPITKKISPHQGIDLAIPLGTPVSSVGNGIVITTRSSIDAGKYITIQHNVNYVTRYMHLKKILVKVGDQIKIGQIIGLSGSTGYSTGPHLHYEVWFKNKVINPLSLKTQEQLTGTLLKNHLCLSNLIINKFKNQKSDL